MFNFNVNILMWSLIIFVSLCLQVLVGMVRLITMVKGNKTLTSIIGFFEASFATTVAIIIISNAVKEGINVYMILFYALGFAAGLSPGMNISAKISKDMLRVSIISRVLEGTIEEKLREYGFGVTCYKRSGRDRDLKVFNIICNMKKNSLEKLKFIVKQLNLKAMVTSHTLEGLSGGFIYDIRR